MLRRFVRGDESGAILVEFALVMPIMLLLFAVAVESGRLLWSYQIAVSGVRDAGRYLARVAPIDICQTGGTLTGFNGTLMDIVEKDLTSNSGNSIFTSGVTVVSVTTPAQTICVPGTYRTSPAPVAEVTAVVAIVFPFSGIFSLFGNALSSTTVTITDQSRIFGQ